MTKLKEKYLYREIDGRMITNIHLNNFNNLPLPNNIELNIPAYVTYKIYKPGDIIFFEKINKISICRHTLNYIKLLYVFG